MGTDQKYWFPAKQYGWGWGPPTAWQGWLALLLSLVALGLAARALMPQQPAKFALVTALIVAVLLVICLLKGEPPAWRWGGD